MILLTHSVLQEPLDLTINNKDDTINQDTTGSSLLCFSKMYFYLP